MRLQVALLLVCVLFPKALTLRCYQCIPGLSGQCNDTQTDCSDQCAIMTTVTYVGNVQLRGVHLKGCAEAAPCVSGSLNLGLLKTTINSKCCSTALCNSNKPPALAKGSPNGRECYTCADDDCSRSVNCEGAEDRCISTRGEKSERCTLNVGGVRVKMKGCVSRSLCSADLSRMKATGISGRVSCCEGNLCNSAEGVKLGLLNLLVPLISSMLFT